MKKAKVKSKKAKGKISLAIFGFYFPLFVALCFWLWAPNFSITKSAQAQTGGNYDLSHSVIASGGGSNSVGGSFTISGTTGQSGAGTISTGSSFSVRDGFWAPDAFAPTAAMVSVSGRVLTARGQGIRNVYLTLTNGTGAIKTAQTTSFGYFHFDGIEVGQTYILEINSKKYVFANPTRVLTVQDAITDADFIGE